MRRLAPCPGCHALLPPTGGTCPHCDLLVGAVSAVPTSAAPRWASLARVAAGAGTGGLLAITLMACYGLPPCGPEEGEACDPPNASCNEGQTDLDLDGYCTPVDCDDARFDVNPARRDDRADGVDDDCDGTDGA